MRKFLVASALLVGVIFVLGHFGELQQIAETLQRGDLRFVTLAILVEMVWMANLGLMYRAIYQALGIRENPWRLLLLGSAANFVNVVAPSAGMGGMAVFVAEANRRRYSSGRATVASVLFVFYEYAGFLLVLAVGLAVLFKRNHLNVPELIASFILLALAVILATLLVLGMRSARQLGNALAWMARQVNGVLWPFLRRNYLSEARAHEFAHDASEGLKELRQNREGLLLPVALSLSNKALLICVLFLMFLAFKVPFTPGTLVATFSISYLFTIVSPTPMGVGVVEGVMALTLNSMNVPLGAATVITLAYRGITFWGPLLVGLVAFRWLGAHERVALPAAPAPPSPDRPSI